MFSFTLNCVICFDQFDHQEHVPVILPCGHTFVCNECAQKLTNCHECRTSLVVIPPKPTRISVAPQAALKQAYSDDSEMPAWYKPLPPKPSPRSRHVHLFRAKKPAKTIEIDAEPIRLPLPKNIVLLELVDAANAKTKKSSVEIDDVKLANMAAQDGVDSMAGECGTYIVRDSLKILKERPAEMGGEKIKRTKSIKGLKEKDSDVASQATSRKSSRKPWSIKGKSSRLSVQSSALPPKSHKRSSTRRGTTQLTRKNTLPSFGERALLSSDSSIIPFEIEHLEPGDKVHVVSFKDGIAKLARRRGYILANSTQLVKVGGPQDEVCRIEGQLCEMMSKKRMCVQELVAMKKRRAKLLQELRINMLEEETRKAAMGSDDNEASNELLKSLDAHFSVPNLPTELLQEAPPSPTNSPPLPESISEVYVDTNAKSGGGRLPPPPAHEEEKQEEPLIPRSVRRASQPETYDDLGKKKAQVDAIRKQYETSSLSSLFFCGSLCY